MKVSQFDFELPESLIATHPAHPRGASRMLAVPPSGDFQDRMVTDLPSLLRPKDILVLNNTRVIPARLCARRGEATIELLLHKYLPSGQWEAFARPAKKLKAGDVLMLADAITLCVEKKLPDGQILLRFSLPETLTQAAMLNRYGSMPLPPYIARKRAADSSDKTSYQTVFAEHDGSVAAPTAGLHFTASLLANIQVSGARLAFVTLHVGAGTFLPMKTDDTEQHVMHAEWCTVPLETVEAVNEAKANGGRIIPIGTTALRTLETAADEQGWLHPFSGDTSIFITPGYRFKITDALFTNFHTPRSTLFMLVCAFAGEERMKAAYRHAIGQQYKFYSYGDACFLA